MFVQKQHSSFGNVNITLMYSNLDNIIIDVFNTATHTLKGHQASLKVSLHRYNINEDFLPIFTCISKLYFDQFMQSSSQIIIPCMHVGMTHAGFFFILKTSFQWYKLILLLKTVCISNSKCIYAMHYNVFFIYRGHAYIERMHAVEKESFMQLVCQSSKLSSIPLIL